MNKYENYVIEFFSLYGFDAQKIPESLEKSPDFIINDGPIRILIELKTKLDDKDLIQQQEEAFSNNEIFENFTVINRDNATSHKIRGAYEQLKTRKETYGADYCFVFLLADGIYANQHMSQFETTLYGEKTILCLDTEPTFPKKCFYYTNSDFFNFRDIIDGAFTLVGTTGHLCISNVSSRYTDVIKSHFVESFKPGVLDPIALEAAGEAYIIDAPIDRKDDEALRDFLKTKYSLRRVVPFNWPNISVIGSINLSES